VDDLLPGAYSGQTTASPWEYSISDGTKFPGGFGPTEVLQVDYWTLRQRSRVLFEKNLYARGLIRRLVSNEIGVGLALSARPVEDVLGVAEGTYNDWTDLVESRYGIWGQNPLVCDWRKRFTFGAIQRQARLEALVSGDVLVVLRQSPVTRLPMVQLVSGERVQTPLTSSASLRKGHEIRHGVEFDPRGRVVAHWIRQEKKPYDSERIPARGAKSGRILSWLVYGCDRRLDDVRGQPLLSIVLQSLQEIDRYRDSVQRKAVINSILALFVKKTEEKPSYLPFTGSATRRDEKTVTDVNGSQRKFRIAEQIPGLVIEELQVGEEPILKGGEGTDTNFGVFEEAVIQAVAWANEVPPEILRLAFSHNYSASAAAINEFRIYLSKIWVEFGEAFCSPIYHDWLISEVLAQRIDAPGLLAALRDPGKFDVLGAWLSDHWFGSIKLTTDPLKQTRAAELLIKLGLSTRTEQTRMLTGGKFRHNVKRLEEENRLMAQAARPTAEFEQEFGVGVSASGAEDADIETALAAVLDEREN
jgi:lambda family phage portal protein